MNREMVAARNEDRVEIRADEKKNEVGVVNGKSAHVCGDVLVLDLARALTGGVHGCVEVSG
jgi:hypothetical protein